MNLREISIEEARNLPSGHELWVGQRHAAVKGVIMPGGTWKSSIARGSCFQFDTLEALDPKFFISTPDAAPIEPDEAWALCFKQEKNVEVLVAGHWRSCQSINGRFEFKNSVGLWEPLRVDWGTKFQLGTLPEPKQRLVIEVDAGVEVPDEFRIIGKENGWSIPAAVISRGVQDA